uniref:40S ribosomal protein S30 n=1 Tax=Capra hircus TaxID=9925 RepID=A0A8C2QUR7_CAPHI
YKLFIHSQELHTLKVTGQETVTQIKALSTLEVAGRMPGGKVHGSLDCAGKVTGQTPKAKTFVPTFGKKSPSANSKSSVILAFSNKAISPNQKNKQNKTMQTMHGDSM